MVNIAFPGAATSLAPDLDIARQQLEALDPDPEAQFGVRTFDDHGDDRRLAVKAHGTLQRGIRQSKNPDKDGKPCCPASLLAFMQRKGAGVFVVPNKLDGGGQLKRHVEAVRALYVDADSRQEVERLRAFIDATGLTPTVRVASGGVHDGVEKEQCYWRMHNCPVAEFTTAQLQLVSRIGTDPAVKDAGRVMRLAGYWHQKREPRQTRILSIDPTVQYDYRAFIARVLAQPQFCDPRGGRAARPATARRGVTTVPIAGPSARLRLLLDRYGGSLPRSVRALLREAVAPSENAAGNRHATLLAAVGRLVGARWSDDEVVSLILPVVDSEWHDGLWEEHLRQITDWTRRQQDEALAAMPAAPSALARAFNAGGPP